MLTKKTKFTIGRLAQAAGVNIETIRFYQKIGLLQQPEKPKLGGFRAYSENDVWRIRSVKRAQELEFTLAEIARLIELVDGGNCDALRREARVKIESISAQIESLERARDLLLEMIGHCNESHTDNCAFIGWLANGEDSIPDRGDHR